MIGDEYLQVQAQLGTALFSLSTLAHGVDMGREVMQTLQDLRAGLREPFLFVVLGGPQSGKTSLVNAFFGQEIFPFADQAAKGKIHLIKYGPEEKQVMEDDHLVEYHHTNTLLRDFNVVDTPGHFAPEQQAMTGQYLAASELALVVFPIINPWATSAWEPLKLLEGSPLKNVVFVLQQCDLRDDFEVQAVTRHLEQTLHERYSSECRVFPVSAKKAYLSRTTGTDREGLFQQSGFGALESYINDTVSQSVPRQEGLRSICQAAQTILTAAGEKAAVTLAFIKKEIEQFEQLNSGLEERRDQSLRLVNGMLWTLAQSYERLEKHGEELLQRLLPISLFPRFTKSPPKEEIPQTIEGELQDSIERQIQSSVELLAADLQKTWRQLHESIGKRFPIEIEAVHSNEYLQDRKDLLNGIQSMIGENMSGVHLQWQMTEFFTETAEWLQIHRDAGPAGVVSALTSYVAGDFSKTLAEAATAAKSITATMKRGKIQARFRADMAHCREELLAVMEGQLRRAIGHFYDEVDESLQLLKIFHPAQRAIYEPRITTVKQLKETFEKAAASLSN